MRATTAKATAWTAALGATLVFAVSAQAIDVVQVVNEDTGASCGTLTSGSGCQVHTVGTAELRVDLGFLGEVHEAECNLEVEMRVSGDASVAVDAIEHNTGPDTNCGTVVTECKLPWNGKGEEDGPVGVVQSSTAVCLDPSESTSNCEGNLAFSIVEEAGEHYAKQFNNASVGVCELDVDLGVEHTAAGNVEIHVNHP